MRYFLLISLLFLCYEGSAFSSLNVLKKENVSIFEKSHRGKRGKRGPIGPQGPRGPIGPPGKPGLAVFPLSSTIFVDGSTKFTNLSQDGSIARPYSTIQQAINAVPVAQNANDYRKVFTIIISSGVYDEDLVIQGNGKHIKLCALGPVTLGNATGPNFQPAAGDIARSITWNVTSGNDFGTQIPTNLTISSLVFPEQGGLLNEGYLSQFRITGSLNVSGNGAGFLSFNGELFNNLNVTGFSSFDLYLFSSHIRGSVQASNNNYILQIAKDSFFDGPIQIGSYGKISRSVIASGMQVSSPLAGQESATIEAPIGIYATSLKGNFQGPAGSIFLLDAPSNYWFLQPPQGSVSGGAIKELIYNVQ